MKVYIGADHGGFEQKAVVTAALTRAGYFVVDCGNKRLNHNDDYPKFAHSVGKKVAAHDGDMGILLCRSGEGMEMAANKVKGVRAALVWEEEVAQETREDNDANVLVLPSDFVSDRQAVAIALTFLGTSFSELERHIRRIAELEAV